MGLRERLKRSPREHSETSRSRKAFVGLGGLALAGLIGFGAGGATGYGLGRSEAMDDCSDAFGPSAMKPVGEAHQLSADQVSAMTLLAKSDTKPVSFHTSNEDLEAVGLAPILDDMSEGRVITVTIPQEVMNSNGSNEAIRDALAVGNILKSWAQDSDSVVKLTPEGTQQKVDPGTEVLVQVQNLNCGE